MSGRSYVLGITLAAALALSGGVAGAQPAAPLPKLPVKTRLHPLGALPPRGHVAPRTADLQRAAVALPPSVDLTPWTVPVGDQGYVNSCVPWAIDYAMTGWYSRYQGLSAPGIRFAPMYAYSQIHQGNADGRGGGSYPAAALTVARDQGLDVQAHYTQGSSDFTHPPTPAERANAAHFTIGSWAILYQGVPGPSVDQVIRRAVAAHRPVALTLPVYGAFDSLDTRQHHLHTRDLTGEVRGYHEVLIVGYDASGVRVQNSWGTSWGDRGFADLDWAFVEQYSSEADVMSGLLPGTPHTPAAPRSLQVQQQSAGPAFSAQLSWQPPAAGSAAVSGYDVSVSGPEDPASDRTYHLPATARSFTVPVEAGVHASLSVSATGIAGAGSAATAVVFRRGRSLPPRAVTSLAGAPGGPVTATAQWYAPLVDGGSPITGYVVTAHQVDGGALVTSPLVKPHGFFTEYAMTLPSTGPWYFTVVAQNAYGSSGAGQSSSAVRAR